MATTNRTRKTIATRDATDALSREDEDGLTVEQEWEQFDAAARRHLGMSGADFLDQYHAGALDDDAIHTAVMHVWLLKPSVGHPVR